ncbi:MAG: GUN4 domain-containing protein [Phormidesmis sp.]
MAESPDSTSKNSFSKHIVDAALKVIMTGGVAGGGFGAFWSLFRENDLPKAIASAVIGISLAYGAKLLVPVHEGNQRRLEKAGKAIDETLDDVTEKAIIAATRFEDKYLLCQASECQAFRSEGLAHHDGIFVPLLKEVFVPLALDLSGSLPGFNSKHSGLTVENRQKQSVWDFLAETRKVDAFRQLAILAWGGYGKTTLLKHIAYLYGTKQQPEGAPKLIPILLILRTYRDVLTMDKPPTLSELINVHHIPNLSGAERLKIPPSWSRNILVQGRAIVMFDGFDEVPKPQRHLVAKWIKQQVRQYRKSVFVVTSRPKAYKEQTADERLILSSSLWVKDFDDQQRRSFVENWYWCQERYANAGRHTPDVKKVASRLAQELLSQIESQPELKALAKNPLLLNMITTFHRRYPGADLPKRRVELYREICQLQLRDRPRSRKLDTLLHQCDAQNVLQWIAFNMMRNHLKRIRRQDLLSLISYELDVQGEAVDSKVFLDQVVQISELIVQQEDEYEFAHLSLQEYLASAAIAAKHSTRESILYKHLTDDWWKATILLYAGQINPTKLVREAMRQGANDLAYDCLQETTKQVDERLKAELQQELQILAERVQEARCSDLEHHLNTRQWKRAEHETYRLMITSVGKEAGQEFDLEELRNFPRESLKAIDNLWIKHSEGKFGFSVQKDIYLKCGGILDGKHHEKAWKKFCYEVGWTFSDGSYIYSNFDIASPRGHLPLAIASIAVNTFGYKTLETNSRFIDRDTESKYSVLLSHSAL